MSDASFASSTGFVSAPLDLQPGLSGFGTLLQLARLNHFRGSDFLAAFGLRFQYRDDLSYSLAFSQKRQAALATAAGLPLATLEGWSMTAWLPFSGSPPWANLPWRLRGCPSCLRAGYHSNLFQTPWMARCPWHRERLIDSCPRCNRPLLDGFRARKLLLECTCGHDAVDETAVLKGDVCARSERREFISKYRSWADDTRQTAELIPPEEADPEGAVALASLVSMPRTLGKWAPAFAVAAPRDVHRIERVRRSRPEPLNWQEHQAMIRGVKDIWPGDPGIADLPEQFCAPILKITRVIAQTAPANAFTARERKRLMLPETNAPTIEATSRFEVLSFPIQRTGEHAYLDLRLLHRTTARSVSHLAWALMSNDPSLASPSSGAHELIFRAIRHTLARGYADGLIHILGRHVPAIFDNARIRSGPRVPWALLEKDRAGVCRIVVAWTPRRPWSDSVNHAKEKRTAR